MKQPNQVASDIRNWVSSIIAQGELVRQKRGSVRSLLHQVEAKLYTSPGFYQINTKNPTTLLVDVLKSQLSDLENYQMTLQNISDSLFNVSNWIDSLAVQEVKQEPNVGYQDRFTGQETIKIKPKVKMFLDDIRDPASTGWNVVRNVDQAKRMIREIGRWPDEMSLDHDLGDGQDTPAFLNWLFDATVRGAILPPRDDFEYGVHSQNPVGQRNLQHMMEWFLTNFRQNRFAPL